MMLVFKLSNRDSQEKLERSYLHCPHDLVRIGKRKRFSDTNFLVNKSCPLDQRILVHSAALVQDMAKLEDGQY